jgi:glycosyltransferase involved in cell wall biosynthesis
MSEPRAVSVVIPLYQQRPLVERAVVSVLGQTWRDFELIVVDDGSSDGGAERVEALSDARVRCIRRPHRGPGAARNYGTEIATGEWVAFLDADDEWSPDFLDATLAAARAAPGTVAVYTGVVVRGNDAFQCTLASGPVPDYFAARLRHRAAATSSSVLVRRAALLAAGGFVESMRYAEDLDTWFRLSCEGPMSFVAAPLVRIEVAAPGRLTTVVPARERAAGLGHVLDTFERYRRAGRIDADRLPHARRFMQHQRGRMAVHLVAAGERGAAWRTLFSGVPLGAHTWREYLLCLRDSVRRAP